MEFVAAVQAIHMAWPWFWPLVGAVLGGVMGSFLGCVAYRLPRGLSLRHPPSVCMSCHTRLTAPDLVPILSWLFLWGKCRHCGAHIPVSALILEIACALVGAFAAFCISNV
jgi:leader peptidase (prepilin peptidase)/N-methyltransferase